MSGTGLGEFGRIRAFFAPLAGPGGLDLRDDAALLSCAPGHQLVATVDAMVEGVHYLPDDPPDLVARKLLRVNLSDLAAMGAAPRYYLLTTALPRQRGDAWVERFAAGLMDDQGRYGVALLGGDSVMTPGPATLSLTAIGEISTGTEIRRSGARPGDRIWVSGTIGDAYLGLKLRRGDADLQGFEDGYAQALTARYRLPEPRVTLGPRLVGIAHAMCDVSDGLLADLGHICETSRAGAFVSLHDVPLSAAAAAVLAEGRVAHEALATGGDDYELLFTAAPAVSAEIERLGQELPVRLTAIGTIERGSGVRLVDRDGRDIPVAQAGWQHFRGG